MSHRPFVQAWTDPGNLNQFVVRNVLLYDAFSKHNVRLVRETAGGHLLARLFA
jgi:hypothetical protein